VAQRGVRREAITTQEEGQEGQAEESQLPRIHTFAGLDKQVEKVAEKNESLREVRQCQRTSMPPQALPNFRQGTSRRYFGGLPNLSLQIAWCRRIYRQNTEAFGVEPGQSQNISQLLEEAMPLYILNRPEPECSYDELREVVVRAKNEKEARTLASAYRGDEGKEVWLDGKQSTCEKLQVRGKSVVICADFYEA
jgi:hypothetical protein